MSMKSMRSGLQRQIGLTAGIAVIVLALIISYFTFFSQLQPAAGQTTQTALLSGESRALGNSIYIFPKVSSDRLEKIEVTNKKGGYTVTRSQDSGDTSTFYVNDNENAPYDSLMFTSLVVAAGNAITSTRVVPAPQEDTEPAFIDYKNYGLDEENLNARYTITTTDAQTYTMRIGFAVSDGKGYYACLEGRNAVYILSNDLENTVFGTSETIITPRLLYPISSEDCYSAIDYFTIWHAGEHFVTIHALTDAEKASESSSSVNYRMTFRQKVSSDSVIDAQTSVSDATVSDLLGTAKVPYNYIAAIDAYSELLSSLTSLEGDQTVAVREGTDEKVSLEKLLEFGLDPINPAHELFFNYHNIINYVIFSERTADGYYYAYAYNFDLIAKVSADKLDFLEWTFPQWVEPAFFSRNIINVKTIEFKSEQTDLRFDLESVKNDKGKYDLTARQNGKLIDSDNFRQFYKVMLTRKMRGGYDGPMPGEDKLYLTMNVTSTTGVVTEYKFYRVDTQRMFLTVDGKGEFYLLASSVKKLERDAIKAANNETVVAFDRR